MTCADCGTEPESEWIVCPRCDGDGTDECFDDCHRCRGTGEILSLRCLCEEPD